LVWFRPERIRTVTWAGDPTKRVEWESEGLSPRSSFESWTQQVRGQSERWEEEVRHVAREFRAQLVEAIATEMDRRKNRELEIVHRMLRHDIRNKAGTIYSYVDLLQAPSWAQRSLSNADVSRYLDRISGASTAIISLTSSAAALSETIEQAGEIVPEPVNLGELLADTMGELRDQYGDQADLTLEGPDEDRSVMVRGGPLLPSLFRNLIENAVKHNDKERAQVTVEVKTGEETVAVRVADNGPGIPESVREKIFGDQWKGVKSVGTGIGLLLVRRIAEAYEGTVRVRENQPEGTVFVTELQRP
jgi:light-regulated signal transduction histidine kinase (bacteriophytochrome)